MKETTISYSPSFVAQIREKDPQFKAMAEQWERAFGKPVQVRLEDGRLVVEPRYGETQHNNTV